jgi:mannose-6-phosphate isomerase-like protein (cupin superfamily)
MSFDVRSVILGPGEGQTMQVPGHPMTYKARKEDTGGAYALVEATVAGQGPPQHIHHAEEEAFYILAGEVNVQVGDGPSKGRLAPLSSSPEGRSTPSGMLGRLQQKCW